MIFSSIPFLYYFLPFTLILYLVSPKRLKNASLLLASLVFYGWGEPKYLLLMVVSILTGYVFGILIEQSKSKKRARFYLVLSLLVSLGILGFFKYADFFITNVNAVTGLSIPLLSIALPIGISFYTFQILSYGVDVYRKDVAAQRNLIDFATYVTMFPQLIAGPIVRYSDIESQLKVRNYSFEQSYEGIRRFIIGLSKKVLIANLLGELCSIFKDSDEKSVLFYWVYAISYTLHIYFDFSGYSDMAIGLGRILGFSFPENFNYPYISKSITEFWRRWHMSLGSWFRDYVYIPMGGNRVPMKRWFLNILVVWMLTGFWHGASWNFIVWGLFFAVFLILENLFLGKLLAKAPSPLVHLYVMFLVTLSFVIFDAVNLGEASAYLLAMAGGKGLPFTTVETLYYLKSYGVILLVAIIGCLPVAKWNKLRSLKNSYVEALYLLGLLLLVTAYLVDGSFNPFLYFRF